MDEPAVNASAAPGHEVRVDGITSEGAGVGRLPDGRAVFVHRTAPGDRVRIALTRESKRWARGRITAILEGGADRRAAPCPHYQRCGGCTLEHLEYAAQLRAKGEIVKEALVRIGKRSSLPEPELVPSPLEFRYRNRVTFTLLRLPEGRVVAGFHEIERPARILDLDGGCLLPEGPVARAWDGLRASWGPGARNLPAGRKLRLTLRANREGAVLLLIEGGSGPGQPESLLGAVPELRGIWSTPAAPGGEPELLSGEASLGERWWGEEVELRPGAFLQANREAAVRLHDAVIEELGPLHGKRLLDAYCGFGVYGRRAAREGASAVGIEAHPGAAAIARAQPPRGFRIIEGLVEDHLEEALPADLVVLNPPRAGADASVIDRLRSCEAGRMVYLSCDAATLARDLHRLGEGYAVRRVQVFDLFPQTAHTEILLTLERGTAR